MRRARGVACLLAVVMVSTAFAISVPRGTAEQAAPSVPTLEEIAPPPAQTPEPEEPEAAEEPPPLAVEAMQQAAPEEYAPDETEVEMLARMLWGEARGIPSDMEKAACVWCVLNRVDDESGAWPDTVGEVLTQRSQFAGYSPDHPATEELKAIAADVLTRWQREKTEGGDVGRVLPAEYTYFSGHGRHNRFRTEYRGGAVWNWSLPNPYEN